MASIKLCLLTSIISIAFIIVFFMTPATEPDFESNSLVFIVSVNEQPTIPTQPTEKPTEEPTEKETEHSDTEKEEEPQKPPKEEEPTKPTKPETPTKPTEPEIPTKPNEPPYTGPNAKYCDPVEEKLEWKRKLRKHICSERPAFYKEIELPTTTHPTLNIQNQIPTIAISVLIHDPDHLNVIIRDPNDIRWELPFEEPYAYVKNSKYLSIEESNFEFEFTESPFSFKVLRKSTKEVIYHFNQGFIFSDNYIEFNFDLPTNNLYGLGERTFSLQFHPGTYSLFIMDRTGEVENGTPGHNTQGHHSVYLMKEKSGNYHMNLLRNINSGEFTLNDKNNIKWIVIGGILDLNFYLGDNNPENAVVKYHEYLGGWTIPAFWAMGHHQHKWWGYRSEGALRTVMEEYKKADLPLDVLWSDIEYLKGDTNFQMDTEKFPPAHMNKLYAEYKKRWVPVVQCFIPSQKTSAAHEFPNVMDLALRNANGTIFNGLSWSGLAYLTDFTHPKAEEFWHSMLGKIQNNWKFSGIWLDANELTTLWPAKPPNCTLRKYGNLPFYPANAHLFGAMALPYPDCVHADGTDEFDVRGMMGFLQCKFTYEYLQKEHKFPFILSRSTMFGSGKYAMHWIADIWASWHHMLYSIGSIATFNIFGIPFTGTDVCGMVGHPRVDAELCARWYQLATFYPFSKNGHAPATQWDNKQEPYTWTGDYFTAISGALKLRYSLLKYFYTLFFLSKGKEYRSGTVFRPLVFEFYDDKTLPGYGSGIHENQFLLGKHIMAAPVMEFRRHDANVYLPNCRWYDLRDYQEVPARGGHYVASAKLTELPPFYLRGGGIFMQQDTKGVYRTEDLDHKFSIIIGLGDFSTDQKAQASGYLLDSPSYSEEDIFAHCVGKDCLLKFEATFELKENEMVLNLNVKREKDVGVTGGFTTENILIMGIPKDRLSESLQVSESTRNPKLSLLGKTLSVGFDKELPLQHESQYTFTFNTK